MSILVRKDGEIWVEWHETVQGSRTVTTYTATYADGRSAEMACDPYPVPVSLNGGMIRGFYDLGIWSLEEIEAVGGKIAVPFTVPEGYRTVGNPAYADDGTGAVSQSFATEVIPPPPEPPTALEKLTALLASYEMTLEELKVVLELSA
ncbi:hypothetical protein [Mesorhizobium sp.]|uniref:hypothetical protein n=1 Tax=Mesorhizobium sp. TaxID=1871066 RepID=UPI003BAD323A